MKFKVGSFVIGSDDDDYEECSEDEDVVTVKVITDDDEAVLFDIYNDGLSRWWHLNIAGMNYDCGEAMKIIGIDMV